MVLFSDSFFHLLKFSVEKLAKTGIKYYINDMLELSNWFFQEKQGNKLKENEEKEY